MARTAPPREDRLESALREAGVDVSADAFLDLIREAAATVRTTSRVDPRTQLTLDEAAALERGRFDLRPASGRGESPHARSIAEYAAMLSDALTVSQAAGRLQVDPSRIRQLLASGGLYGVKVRGEWRLPSFQFTPGGLVPGIQEVLRRMPDDLHPVEVLGWFRTPDPDLEVGGEAVSPLQWLGSGGDPARAADVAADM